MHSINSGQRYSKKATTSSECWITKLPKPILNIIAEYCLYNEIKNNYQTRETTRSKKEFNQSYSYYASCTIKVIDVLQKKGIYTVTLTHEQESKEKIGRTYIDQLLKTFWNEQYSMILIEMSVKNQKLIPIKPFNIDRNKKLYCLMESNKKKWIAYSKNIYDEQCKSNKNMNLIPLIDNDTIEYIYPCPEFNVIFLLTKDLENKLHIKHIPLDSKKEVLYMKKDFFDTFLKTRRICKNLKNSSPKK